MNCPSEIELEQWFIAKQDGETSQHVHSCEKCSQHLKWMERETEHFRAYVFPSTIDAVIDSQKGFHLPKWVWAPLPVAAALILVWAGTSQQPDPSYVGIKGRSLAVSIFAASPDGVMRVEDGQAVAAKSALRFRVRPGLPCYLHMFSVDGRGTISRFYPSEGDEGVYVKELTNMPGGAALDGTTGPERVYAVCSEQPLSFMTLERSVHDMGVGDAIVRKGAPLVNLPDNAMQSSILLEKTP